MNYIPLSRMSIPDRNTGEIKTYVETSPGFWESAPDPLVSLARRWRMKYEVRRLLGYGSRQAKCCRWRIPTKHVEIFRSVEYEKTFFSGLEICSSVWLCPLCAAKISERRVKELESALESAKSQKLWVQLLTLTFPHGLGDRLSAIKRKLINAYSGVMLKGKYGQKLRSDLGFVGTIRALEVTHGPNGWHPHIHVLIFTPNRLPLSLQVEFWRSAWKRACRLVDLPVPSDLHGCTLQNGSAAAQYVSKWGLAQEMAKAHLKKGKLKGASPWDLLAISSGDTWDGMPSYSRSAAADLWLTYSRAFKGERQLVWSKGLKNLLGVDVKTDEELAQEETETAARIYLITDQQWSWILSARAEVDVLSVARDCPDALESFIDSLKTPDNFSSDLDLIDRFGHLRGSSTWTPF